MRFLLTTWSIVPCLFVKHALAVNFPYESIQLTEAEVRNQTDLQFGNTLRPAKSNAVCKTFPGDAAWPSDARWAAFNATLGGALIKPKPVGAVCYSGPDYNPAKCIQATLANPIEDPSLAVSQWTQGDSCAPSLTTRNKTCKAGGTPAYVVNATNVKQVQLAVNFARNHNLRLIVKNTGHDFLGRSSGAGSLSVWTHHFKSFEYLTEFSNSYYSGAAARVGTGLQAWEMYGEMAARNITLVVPITVSVGAFGGPMQGGGHSHFTSYYGTIADQVVSLQVVTADGKFVTVDSENNEDLFFALRGGGGGTWGVVTSAVIKAYPNTPFAENDFGFEYEPKSNTTSDAFWEGVKLYHAFVPNIVDAGGQGSNYITPRFNSSAVAFRNTIWMPEMSAEQLDTFTKPLINNLQKAGLNVSYNKAVLNPSYGKRFYGGRSAARSSSGSLLGSRLFPRENFEDPALLNATMLALRKYSEAGYSFHSNNYSPTEEVAGYPDNALNTAFRNTASHASGFDTRPATGDLAEVKASHDRFQKFIQAWRDVSPRAGCYMNEASVMEPNWQWAFYGENYPELQRIKNKVDPWGLFYVTTGVGSENWEVQTPGAIKSQDGKLCKLAKPSSSWQEPEDNRPSVNRAKSPVRRINRRSPVRHQL